MTIYVAKAARWNVRSIEGPQVRYHHSRAGLSCGSRHSAAFSRSRSTRLCIARSDDDSNTRRCLGGAAEPRGLDTSKNLPHHCDVRVGGYADSLLETATCKGTAVRLLRGQRLSVLKRTHFVRLCYRGSEADGEMAGALDCSNPASIGNGANGAVTTAAAVGSTTGSDCANIYRRRQRPTNTCSVFPSSRRQQEIGRKTFPGRGRNNLWEMAATTSAHASLTPVG